MHSYWYKARLVCLILVVLLGVGCNDVYRPIVTPVPLPGGDPGATDYAAVLSKNPSGGQDIVTFINVSGDTNVGNRLVGPGAAWAAWNGARTAVFVPNETLNTVSQVATSTTSLNTASLFPGSLPTFGYSRNVTYSYVLNSGPNADCPSSASIGVLLNTNNSLQSNICVGPSPVFFTQTSDGARLIVLDNSLNQAWIVNVNTNIIEAKLAVGSNPVYAVVSTDNSTAYVANKGSNDITVIDIANGLVKNASIPTNGSSPVYMAVDRSRTRLYVSNQASDTVSVFDISTLAPVTLHGPVAVGNAPASLAVLPDGSAIYVASTGTNSVTLINGNSFLTQQIPVSDAAGATVTWVGTSVAGSKVYATVIEPTDTKNGTAVIRVTDNVLVTTIGAPQQDLTCKPTSTVTCPLMRPAQVVTRQQQ